MTLSLDLTPEEEALLEEVSRRTERNQDDLARQAIREFCQSLVSAEKSPYELGRELFGTGALAVPPADPGKHAVWEKLRAKHQGVG
jgi:hypothetical protein